MLSRRNFLLLVGSTGVAAGGIALGIAALPGDSSDDASGPPTIRFGEENCDTCGMVISDVRHSSAWRDASGKARRFDDIGCMITKMNKDQPAPGRVYYIHDYSDESWLEAPSAVFVIAPSIKGPMAYGIAALSTRNAAEVLATENGGTIYDWDGAIQAVEQ